MAAPGPDRRRHDDSPLQRARENLTGIVSVLVTGTWLAALLLGFEWWLPLMLVGYIVVVPIVALLFGDEDERSEWWNDGDHATQREREGDRDRNHEYDKQQADALETLRERYARGELTDEQFERKLERLLEVETLEDLEDGWVTGAGEGAPGPPGSEGAPSPPDADREPETES